MHSPFFFFFSKFLRSLRTEVLGIIDMMGDTVVHWVHMYEGGRSTLFLWWYRLPVDIDPCTHAV